MWNAFKYTQIKHRINNIDEMHELNKNIVHNS